MSAKILVIDDEDNNRAYIRACLEDEDYDIIEARDGEEGWSIFQKLYLEINLVLLDKMMPKLDGISVLKNIRNDEKYSHIPVIMQTASALSRDYKDSLELGVFHYLIKPYDDDVLLALIKSALRENQEDALALEKLSRYEHMLHMVDDCRLSFKSLDDAEQTSVFLASFYPNPKDVLIGIRELLINAVEHGNLGITYDEKTKLLTDNSWKIEVERRLTLPEYADRTVKISYSKTKDKITLVVTDDGNGFDWRKRMDLNDDILTQSHGRGIPMCKHLYFHEFNYNEKGNQVTAVIKL